MLSYEYIAGLFDGEGCVNAQRTWMKGKYEKYPRIHMQIDITNTYLPVLEQIMAFYGFGKIYPRTINGNGKQCWTWKMVGKTNMMSFLKSIEPYAIIKKDDISYGLQFIETLRDENLGCRPLSPEIHTLREHILQCLRKNRISHKKEVSNT